jgi:hypothetical protein
LEGEAFCAGADRRPEEENPTDESQTCIRKKLEEYTYNIGVKKTRLIRDMGMILCPSDLIGGSLETAIFLSSSDKYFALVISGISGK